MTADRKQEQTPWSPQIEGEPLFNPFEDPQVRYRELRDPVALMDEDSDEEKPPQEAGTALDQAPPSEDSTIKLETK